MQLSRILALTLIASPLVACTDDSPDIEPALLKHEGIYEVLQHTLNETSCSRDGATALPDTEKFVVAKMRFIFDTPYLQIASCASVAKCRELVASFDRDGFLSYEFGFAFDGVDGSDLVSQGATSGFFEGGMCKEGDVYDTRLFGESSGQAWRIDKEITIADDYAADGIACGTDGARKAARGNTCSQLEHLSVRRVENL